jgi:SOS-response transcriptional repressor LexA
MALHSRVDTDEIIRRMEAKGLRRVDLARALGIAPNKITKAFNGERQFKVPEMDILRRMLTDEPESEPLRTIPVIGMVAAGRWREAVQQSRASMPIPDPSVPPRAIALEVVGDSMDLLIEEGGRVIVDPDDKALFPGRYYVIINADGETTFKQFKADPARLVPCSSNPEHQEIPIGGERFEVVGRVIWRAARM